MYKCYVCRKQFRGGSRINSDLFWKEYLENKQTYQEIAIRYGVSESTVKRKISTIREVWSPAIPKKAGFLLLDTTYFGRSWGVLVAMDAQTGAVLYRKYLNHERIGDYVECVSTITGAGFVIKGIVIDGMRGLFQSLGQYPVQMCQYHQCAILRRYLTKNPKLEAGKELLQLSGKLATSTLPEFANMLAAWELKWEVFLNERSISPITDKGYYVHKRLRSARRSINNNLRHLFVYQSEMNIGLPNTNNKLEGKFTDLKKNLNAHSGMNKENRKRFIDGFFKA